MTDTLTQADLDQFIGSEHWYKTIIPVITCTDGVQYMASKAGAFWLVDEIALAQPYEKRLRGEAFQLWVLKVDLMGKTGRLICEDGNGNMLLSKMIPYTDFPLEEVKLFFTNNVIMLPSEY